MNKIILIVTGLPGSGKTAAAKIIKRMGLPIFRTGQAVKDEVARRGLPYTIENSETVAREMREKTGPDAPARITAEEKIKPFWREHPEENVICVEGLRDMHEVDYLASLGRIIILVVETPLETRFRRMTARRELRDPKDLEEMKWRARKEKERGMQDIFTTEKYPIRKIPNTGTLEELRAKLKKLLKEIRTGKD